MNFIRLVLLLGCLGLLSLTGPKPGVEKTLFGTLPDDRDVYLFTLRNAAGMEVAITNYGGYVVSLAAPDRRGKQENVVLGLPILADYLKGSSFLGPIVGRFGNRIAGARFSIDGIDYSLAANSSGNHLHGGRVGFDKKLWTATPVDGAAPALKLQYTSPDGEEGYPGQLSVEVTYTLQKDNALRIDYRATTDKPTVLNLTNHTYFNLSGLTRDVLNQTLQIRSSTFLPTTKTQIPTGERRSVVDTPFDFTKPTPIGARISDTTDIQMRYGNGYDHCWVLTDSSTKLKPGATLYEPESGRLMEMFTTEPAVQVYTANHLNGRLHSKTGTAYTRRFGVCLETQHFPDSPNHPEFPTTVLRPGQTFRSTTVFKFSVR